MSSKITYKWYVYLVRYCKFYFYTTRFYLFVLDFLIQVCIFDRIRNGTMYKTHSKVMLFVNDLRFLK